MRAVILSLLIALTAGSAQSQTATVKLTADDTHVIKEIVLKELNYPKSAAGDYKVGDKAPTTVNLESFPPTVTAKVSNIKAHKFFVSGEKIVVVDPKDDTIAEVIE